MIPGISDVARLPRLGKIRLGEKRVAQSGKEYPAALDHFNFTDAPDLLKMFGANCKEIDVIIPNENIARLQEKWHVVGVGEPGSPPT